MAALTDDQKKRLGDWRREVLASDHLLSADRLRSIEKEVQNWSFLKELNEEKKNKFYEPFVLYDAKGSRRDDLQTWRGLCHWLWLRHACVHGLFFTPSRMVMLQRRSMSVYDSPGYIDMTFAGHGLCFAPMKLRVR